MSTLTTDAVWTQLAASSFAVLSHVTPKGEPRSTGVVYTTVGRRLYVIVAADGWKAKHIAVDGRVSMTVTVRRGGLLTLLFPIPPATISFRAAATIYSLTDPQTADTVAALNKAGLLPKDTGETSRAIEIRPEGHFVTYGIGVPLMKMRDDPGGSRSRVPVA
jgi:pyridoxamine 5'-phosphate oxidase-like protein